MHKRKKRLWISPMKLIGGLVTFAYAMALTVPLFMALMTSFKTEQERVINPSGLPENFTWSNYVEAAKVGNLLTAAKNSIIISVGATIGCMLLGLIVAYALNRIREYKIGTVLYMLVLSTLFIPAVGTATGLMLRRSLGLYDNLYGEIICASLNITMPVFMFSAFMRNLPKELEEAAILDGASDRTLCFRITAPLIKPVMVSMAILTFRGQWNNCLGPMLTLRRKELYTIPMALLVNFTQGTATIYTTMFAGVFMTAIPVIVLYCLCQEQFTDALVGGVKG